ncbi:MAG: hypothetical protein IBJ09_00865 [Bacteroidia bacterium]|nr:hypothetical protein [Bacteroidia bacterium]
MRTSLAEATHSPGIISIPGKTGTGNSGAVLHSIVAVPDVRSYMEQQQLSEAFIIYLDSLAEAERFLDELNASREPD